MLIASLFILLWSSGYIFAEMGLRYSDPLAFLSLRLWFAWIIIALIFLSQRPSFPRSLKQFLITILGMLLVMTGLEMIHFKKSHERALLG